MRRISALFIIAGIAWMMKRCYEIARAIAQWIDELEDDTTLD